MKRCVVILVKNADKFLLGRRRDSKKLSFPAGHINHLETPREAAKRELKEETGLDSTKLKLIGVDHVKPGHMVYVYSAAAAGDLDPKNDPDKEFSKLSYLDLSNISEDAWHIPRAYNSGLRHKEKA